MFKKPFFFIVVCTLFFGISYLRAKTNVHQRINNFTQQTIRGKVLDHLDLPINGATVTLLRNSIATFTDSNGDFTIPAKIGDKIRVTYSGYKTTEFIINQENITIRISPDNQAIDEIVVIGYGTTTKRSIVAAVDQVNSKLLENRPVANLTQALQGAAPSLIIQQRSMNPNSNTMNINIRGISSMNSNGPLVVIDGLIAEPGTLNNLNPADVDNISILKDAGSAAIYGSRSSNGVILVSTKSGKNNQTPRINFNSLVGFQDPQILFSPVSGYQNATLKNLALSNVGSDNEFTPDQIQDLYNHKDVEKWNYDQIMQKALQQNHNMSISGGGENSTYLFSTGYLNQKSNFAGNKDYGIQRYNIRSNLSAEYGIFKIASILSYARNNILGTTATNAIINSSRIPPYYYYKMQADNGKYLVNNALTDQNPLGELREGGYIKNGNDYFNANVSVDIKILKSLKLRGVVGADINADHRFIRRIEVPLYISAEADKPFVFMNSTRNTEDFNAKSSLMNYQLLLEYNKLFNKHELKGLFGATNESYSLKTNEIKLIFTEPFLGTPTTGTKIDPSSKVSLEGTQERSLSSLIGRLNYNYDQKYFIEGTFRYDGSSRFAKENRWGFFPSISAGWRLSEEDFMKIYKDRVGDIKFRSSYGILGNQDMDPYQYLTVYSTYNNTYGFNNESVTGAGFVLGNNDLRWEKTKNFNLGLDARFFNNKLTANLDYFIRNTQDILLTPETPTVLGTTLSKMNIGKMKNQGWEATISYRGNTGSFQHGISVNVGDTHNEVTYFEGKEQISSSDGVSKITREGLPYNSYYGYKVQGLFQNLQEIETAALPVGVIASDLQPGDVRYTDRNNDGIIDAKDRFILGNAFPRFTFGLNYELKYKNFDFNMFWQGVGKRDMMVRGELVEPFHSNYSYVIYQHQLDYWTPTNTGTTQPRLTAAGSTSTKNNYQMDSDIYKFNGRYARLKNIQIGYTLPQGISEKLHLKNARVFINAQNLLTLSLNSWIDPESSEFDGNMSGHANSARNYPTLKYYGFGLNINF